MANFALMNTTSEFMADGRTFHGVIPLIMGTRLEMLVIDTEEAVMGPVWNWLCLEAEHLNSILNRYDPESELTRLNCSDAPMKASGTLASLIRLAIRCSERTLGLFDISKGHFRDISVTEDDVAFTGGYPLDFGGIAKGYLLSRLKEKLVLRGVKCAFVDFGSSSILTMGHHPYGDCWKVGVQNPFGYGALAEVELNGQSMSTSGNTPSHGLHIIDPRTGLPNNDRKAVTVIADDPLDAEVVSTALMLADDGMKAGILAHFPGLTEKTFTIR